MDLQKIYNSSPFTLQNIALSAYSVILNHRYYPKSFKYWYNIYNSQEYWSRKKIEEYQLSMINWVIEISANYVPFYKKKFSEKNLGKIRIENFSDISKLPIVEKETIRRNQNRFLNRSMDHRTLIQDRTSGSTGTPLVIFWPKKMFPKWWALVENRVRNWANVSQSLPRAMIGGRAIIPGNCNGHYWRYNYFWKQLYMSSYHISSSTAKDYIQALKKYESKWITGYGSAIALLGEWLCNNQTELSHISCVLTSGDNLLDGYRKSIEGGFRTKVYDYYGSAEGCLLISECEHGRLHLQPESGFLEILDEKREPCGPGEVGEMVVTGLINDAMPLIRYRTGDLAAWSKEQNCPCGRASSIISHIDGRADDYIVLKNGRKIGRLSTAIKKSLNIRSAQIIQDKPGHAFLLICPTETYRYSDGNIIKDDILDRIGNFKIDVYKVDMIPKDKSGKQRLVVRIYDNKTLLNHYKNELKGIL